MDTIDGKYIPIEKIRYYYSEPVHFIEVLVGTDNYKNNVYTIRDHEILSKRDGARITICGILDTETNTQSFGVAVCSPKDRFDRRIGRALAEERARTNPVMKCVAFDTDTFIVMAKFIENKIKEMSQFKITGNL